MRPDEVHTLTGAYALDALSDDERAAFEEHLAGCASCAREVRELTATAARLALSEARPVPPSLKAEVMRRVASLPQLPPDATEGPGPVRETAARPLRWRPDRRSLVWALAASVAGAVALGGVAIVQHRSAEEARRDTAQVEQTADAVAGVLAAPDARLAATRLPQGASGTVVVSESRDRAVFTATGLSRPAAGKVYQLWFDDGGTMRPAGLMDPDSTTTVTLLDGPVGRATGMGLTLEPSGGSPRPTTTPLAVVAFPAA